MALEKKVKFSSMVEIKEIPPNSDESRGIARFFVSGLFRRIDFANMSIMNRINTHSPHKIISITPEEISFKIYSLHKSWCEDDTSIIFLEKLEKSRLFLQHFISEYNRIVSSFIERGKSSSLEYTTSLGGFRIKILAVMRQ